MIFSLSLFTFNRFGAFTPGFPVVFWAETLMLTFGGIACLIKGGIVFSDTV
jgi:hypothetical protein